MDILGRRLSQREQKVQRPWSGNASVFEEQEVNVAEGEWVRGRKEKDETREA